MTIYSPFTHVAMTNWANALLRELAYARPSINIDLVRQLNNIDDEMARRGFKPRFTVQYWKRCACGSVYLNEHEEELATN